MSLWRTGKARYRRTLFGREYEGDVPPPGIDPTVGEVSGIYPYLLGTILLLPTATMVTVVPGGLVYLAFQGVSEVRFYLLVLCFPFLSWILVQFIKYILEIFFW